MTGAIFLTVLGAAALHAIWNELVKGGGDKILAMVAVVVGQGLFGGLALLFVPLPNGDSLPYLALSVALHIGYQAFLLQSYRLGDLTQVYPIARGTAPLIVAAVSVGFLGVVLDRIELIGIVVIGAGIVSLSFVRQQDGMRNRKAAAFAFVTGCFIASYSLVDGLGARVSGSAVGFYGCVAVLNGLLYTPMMWIWKPRAVAGLARALPIILVGGGASFAAYALVVYAFTQAPIAMVTALRETSIIFALLIGVFFLKERLDLAKVVSTMVTICGAALLRLSKG